MAIGKCLKCDKVAEMTQDHVFPKWLRKALPNFGIKPISMSHEIQLLCSECNGKKGSSLDFSNVATREAIKKIVVTFTERIREHEEFNP